MKSKVLRTALIAATILSIAGLSRAQNAWKRVSSFTFDWNERKSVQVVLDIPASWTDPGDFTRVRIRVPGQKEFTVVNGNGWVKYGSDVARASPEIRKATNLANSKYVLALKATDKRTLLFLLGYSYASSPGNLDVLELSDDGHPRVVLHREEFGLLDVRDLNDDGVAEVIGYPCLSQEFGNGLETYDPLNVYRLGTTSGVPATLSESLSKDYNLKHYFGWVGIKCSEDFAVVLHPPKGGKPRVMTTKDAEKLTGSGPN
jgi:hypothetical protein